MRLLTHIVLGILWPLALPGSASDPLAQLGGRRDPYVYKKDRFKDNLQVISRIRGTDPLPTNNLPKRQASTGYQP